MRKEVNQWGKWGDKEKGEEERNVKTVIENGKGVTKKGKIIKIVTKEGESVKS